MPYAQPKKGDSFITFHGDFVSTESGTGIVHVAPSFGSDDMIIAKKNNIDVKKLKKNIEFSFKNKKIVDRYLDKYQIYKYY